MANPSEINEALASLDLLMSEFFAPTTSNLRKREIENMLENFSNRRDSWKHCLLFLQKSQNQYVLMFTLTTLENIINRQWISIMDSEKTEVRLTLWNELITKHEHLPNFIRNKLAALMVSIARYDWPHLYPDFFSNIVELVQSEDRRCLLGLILAQAASEELGAARDTGVLLTTARRNDLERLMLKGMPQLLSVLSAILEKNAPKDTQSNPPPSPTSGFPQSSSLPDLLVNTHDVHVTDKSSDMEIVVKCLSTLQHLFSWLPLSSHVPPSLVTTVFFWGSIATQDQSKEAALAGLSGICELLYRRYAPPSSATTALRLHHCALRLLRHLTLNHHHLSVANTDYLIKLAEFLKLFISLHFKRLETEPEFDAIDLLSYLFQYTFQVPNCAIFVNCLDVWIQFIDVLKPEDTAKYWEALKALVNGILNKIQFQHNKSQLQQLDNDICDDDGETEWQTFSKHCIECIARVAELAPLDVFVIVVERWQGLAGVWSRASARGAEGDRLVAALGDLATLTRALGRLAPPLLNEGGGGAAGLALVERVAAALCSSTHTQLHAHLHHHHLVMSEMFACMSSWSCYLRELNTPPRTLDALFSAARTHLLPQHCHRSGVLCAAASQLLLSMSQNVKFTSDPIAMARELFEQAHNSLDYLDHKSANAVRESLILLCVRSGASGGSDAARTLLWVWASGISDRPTQVLPALTHLLNAFHASPTNTKRILAEGVTNASNTALGMLCDPTYAPVETEITDYFYALFTCLLHHLGGFIKTAIDVFLDVAQRGGSVPSVERLVECVRLGVERGASGAGGAGGGTVSVSPVLELLHSHILPRAHQHPDLARAALRLLASVLIHRWQYFFPSKCKTGSEEEAGEAARMDELRAALSALGRALLQPDIELFKITIETLETLNTRWRLYSKAIFRSEFLGSFLSVLLGGVAERGGGRALVREETLQAVHAMAAVDFPTFRNAFLPHFLRTLPGLSTHHLPLLDNFPTDTDLPTFTQNIQKLMNDVNCYRAYSALAPPT